MAEAERPIDESERLQALRALGILDTPPEERFDRITRTVARHFGVPIALVSLVDTDRQWFKSCIGLPEQETARSESFCAHALLQDDIFVIPDTLADHRFVDNALVTGPPFLRFYAGYPLRSVTGQKVGTLCLLDRKPRELTVEDRAVIVDLAAWAEGELNNVEVAGALETIARSERQFQRVVSSVGDAIITFDSRFVIDSANAGADRLFGCTPGWLVGRPVLDVIAAHDHQSAAQLFGARLNEERVEQVRLEIDGVRDSGDGFPMEVVIDDLEGSELRFIAVARDISQRRYGEQELDRLRRRLAGILASAAEGIFGVDAEGRITFVNDAATGAFGYRRDQLLGEVLHAAVHDRRADGSPYPWEECPTRRTIEDGTPRRVLDEVFWRADGTCFPVEHASAPIIEEGIVVGAVVTFSDITERREVERMKEEFISVVSHELRTPLTSIRGSLGLLASGVFGALSEEGDRMLTIAVSNTDRLVRLVNDILDLERITSGRSVMELRDADLAELVRTAVAALQGQSDQARVTLDVRAPALLLRVDSDRIVQVLVNLLGNAIKFSPSGGTVSIDLRRDGDDARIEVTDRGRGIPPADLERIFERFQQVDATDAREKGGTGLGLPIARSIVEQHGGRLWAENRKGDGATFCLVLPGGRRGPKPVSQASGSGGLVVVVEDDEDIAAITRQMLERHDIQVLATTTEAEGVRAAQNYLPGAIILDVSLDEGDALGVMTALRSYPSTRDIPVVVYTVHDLSASERAALRQGPVDFLIKSRVAPDALEDLVLRLLAQGRSDR